MCIKDVAAVACFACCCTELWGCLFCYFGYSTNTPCSSRWHMVKKTNICTSIWRFFLMQIESDKRHKFSLRIMMLHLQLLPNGVIRDSSLFVHLFNASWLTWSVIELLLSYSILRAVTKGRMHTSRSSGLFVCPCGGNEMRYAAALILFPL